MIWLNASTRCSSCPNRTKWPPFRTLVPLSMHHIDPRLLYHHQDKVSDVFTRSVIAHLHMDHFPGCTVLNILDGVGSVSHMDQTI